MSRERTGLCVVLALAVLAASSAQAITWTGAAGVWTGGGNWDTGVVPTSSDIVYINNIGTAQIGAADTAVASHFYLGNASGQSGAIELSGGTFTAAGNHSYVGNSGTGTFTQTGGAATLGGMAIYLGMTSTGDGTYTMSNGSLNATYMRVGESGTGLFDHSGGTVTIVSQNLIVGRYSPAHGTYNLSGTGQLLAPTEYIGCWSSGTSSTATGTFNQSGGSSNTVGSNLYIGNGGGTNLGGTGTYTLTGGTLSVGGDIIDNGATGTSNFYIDGPASAYTLTVTGGDIKVDNFGVGYGSGSTGEYILSSGTLTANKYTYVGYNGTGTFTQSGGTHTIVGTTNPDEGDLQLGVQSTRNGTYNLTGGTLTIDDDLYVGVSGTGNFTQSGAASSVSVGDNLGIGWSGGGTGTYTLKAGSLAVTGDILDGGGTSNLHIDGTAYILTVNGGDIKVDNFAVGYNGGTTGGFTIAAGRNVSANFEYIGHSGTGTVTQTGGSNTVTSGTGAIYIGNNASGNGTYTLTDGTLAANYLRVGENGTGTFNHSGGTVTVTANNLIVGRKTGATGTYNLSGTGQLSAPTEYIGGYEANVGATGTFNQSGGTNTISSGLYIGYNGGIGTYTISDGTLDVGGTLFVGNNGGTGLLKIVGDDATIEADGYNQNAASTLELDINGVSPINVDGSVVLDGFLNVEFTAIPGPGEWFPIILNDSDDAVSGIFVGMPEWTMFRVPGFGMPVQITYKGSFDGGTIGNDVALFTTPEPTTLALLGLGVLGVLRRRTGR